MNITDIKHFISLNIYYNFNKQLYALRGFFLIIFIKSRPTVNDKNDYTIVLKF